MARPGATGPMPAVLLGGNVTAVPACRSLGRAGIRVVGALGRADDPIRHSRYCAGVIEPGEHMQDSWLSHLLEEAAPSVLLPCSDDGVELVARNRAALEERGHRCVEGNDDRMLAMLDKDRTYELAHAAGVATPLTHTVRAPADIGTELDAMPYPCGLKPVHGHLFAKRSGIKAKLLVVRDRDELESRLGELLSMGLEMQVTEIVQGGDDRLLGYFTYLDEAGQPLMHFTNRKLRQLPAHFGVGSYVIGEELPDVAEAGLRFAQGAGLLGVAHVEFKRDARDEKLKLIECNHRFNLAIGLLVASGLDLPLFSYNRLVGRPGPRLDSPRYGLRLWHPVPDFRAFLALRAEGELTARRWLRSLMHPQHFSLLAADDPLPSLVDHAHGIVKLGSKAARRGSS